MTEELDSIYFYFISNCQSKNILCKLPSKKENGNVFIIKCIIK